MADNMNMTPMEALVNSKLFKNSGMACVILTCILLTLYNPGLETDPTYLMILNLFVSTYFVVECMLLLYTLGFRKYFYDDSFRILDFSTSLASLVELVIFIVLVFDKHAIGSNASAITGTNRTN